MSVHRLNYIGSKYQLLPWIESRMKVVTGWVSFKNKTIADLFAGTGIVSHFFRTKGSVTIVNDAEIYSSIIAHALSISTYTPNCKELISKLNVEMSEQKHADTAGFVTTHYSPRECERMFFTVENAQRIDYIRSRLASENLSVDDQKFMMASLLLSADAVSNVPAVYGCYLKSFKTKAQKEMILEPVHEMTEVGNGTVTNCDVLSTKWIADAVYLDPPYNNRQYSKNYFPLNVIAMPPDQTVTLTGKTGIPDGCFLSEFCQKNAASAFERLFQTINAKYIFMSYSSEGIVSKAEMLNILKKYGTVVLYKRPHKRFKSFEYNDGNVVTEYLFCLTRE